MTESTRWNRCWFRERLLSHSCGGGSGEEGGGNEEFEVEGADAALFDIPSDYTVVEY